MSRIITGDCRDVLKTLPDQSVNCIVTSPPYFGLRDYGMDAQIGGEQTPPRESRLIRAAQDVQAQAGSHRANGGRKTNGPMKVAGIEAIVDKQRGHGRTHAGFNARWDAMTRAEQQSKPAMMRDVWFVSPGGFRGSHFAVMANEIARRCILAGCPEGGVVLDPFFGAGTTGLVAQELGREYIGVELNPEYVEIAERRIAPPVFDRAALLAAALL